jgi:hypothetical protein
MMETTKLVRMLIKRQFDVCKSKCYEYFGEFNILQILSPCTLLLWIVLSYCIIIVGACYIFAG